GLIDAAINLHRELVAELAHFVPANVTPDDRAAVLVKLLLHVLEAEAVLAVDSLFTRLALWPCFASGAFGKLELERRGFIANGKRKLDRAPVLRHRDVRHIAAVHTLFALRAALAHVAGVALLAARPSLAVLRLGQGFH